MLCTIQLVYNDTNNNEETIQIIKSFDITGNTVIRIRKEKEAEKMRQEEEERKLEEELKNNLSEGDEIVEVEGENDKMSNVIKKFRNIFEMTEEEFDDDYVKKLIIKSKYDFNYTFNIHIESYDVESSQSENLLDDGDKLNGLKIKIRDSFKLSQEEFPDEEIEDALKKGKVNIHKSFARLMTKKE